MSSKLRRGRSSPPALDDLHHQTMDVHHEVYPTTWLIIKTTFATWTIWVRRGRSSPPNDGRSPRGLSYDVDDLHHRSYVLDDHQITTWFIVYTVTTVIIIRVGLSLKPPSRRGRSELNSRGLQNHLHDVDDLNWTHDVFATEWTITTWLVIKATTSSRPPSRRLKLLSPSKRRQNRHHDDHHGHRHCRHDPTITTWTSRRWRWL